MDNASFLCMFLVVIAIMAIVPFLLRRIGIPSVISLLLVGMLMGDTGIGANLIPRMASAFDFLDPATTPERVTDIFTAFIDKSGALGLMFLMSLAGMEADFNLLKTCRRPVFWLSILTFTVPAVGGFLLYQWYFPDQIAGQLLYASLFASHSVGIVFPVVRELDLTKTRFGASVLIATVITDIASIILLAVSVQLHRQGMGTAHMVLNNTLSILDHNAGFLGNSFMPVFLGIVLVYMLVSILTVNKVGKWLIQRLNPGEDLLVTLVLLVILGAAFVGELFGINFIVGSFIAGLGLSKVIQAQGKQLFRKFESIGYGFLIPFLFVSIGMSTDFRVFAKANSLEIAALTVVVLVFTKMASGMLAMGVSGFRTRACVAAGLMTVPQLSATLTAAAIGKSIGILDEQFFNAIIILSIVTTLPVPSLVRHVVSPRRSKFVTDGVENFEAPVAVKNDELL